MSKGNLAIIGEGEVSIGRYSERPRWNIIYDACMQAVENAGIDKVVYTRFQTSRLFW